MNCETAEQTLQRKEVPLVHVSSGPAFTHVVHVPHARSYPCSIPMGEGYPSDLMGWRVMGVLLFQPLRREGGGTPVPSTWDAGEFTLFCPTGEVGGICPQVCRAATWNRERFVCTVAQVNKTAEPKIVKQL